MRVLNVLALTGLATALAVPLERKAEYAVHSEHFVPRGWRRLDTPRPDDTIALRLGLKQGSFHELERHLYEVSDPDHPRYGQHLSHGDIQGLTRPSEDALDAVHEWLQENGIYLDRVQYSPARDWLTVALPVSDVEDLLDTNYHEYTNDEGVRVVRTTKYSLPRSLHEHVDVVQPTNYFGNTKALGASPFGMGDWKSGGDHQPWHHGGSGSQNLSAVCNETAVTNLCLRTLYKTVDYVPQVPGKNYVATTNYLNQTANYSDFHIFMSEQRKDADPSYQYSYQIVADGVNNQNMEPPEALEMGLDLEANQDVQTVGGFVYPTRFTTYSTGGLSPVFTPDLQYPTNGNEPYLTWLSYVLAQKDLPYVISTSYADDEQTVPINYARRVCAELAQLGARGVTLLFATGDYGVGTNGTCLSNDGKNTTKFLPMFPASCPYVTAVGGTRNIPEEVVTWDESNSFVSGGGLSNYFPRPAYQDGVVEKYLGEIGSLHEGLYNRTGRAYPDLSAQGYRYQIVYAGQTFFFGGTSAAAPTVAGVLTNVNDALLAAGRPPLGFLNPWLYKNAGRAFNDVKGGNIWGCNTSGFPAKEEWDVASGFGTPDFGRILGDLFGKGGGGEYGGGHGWKG
ncbi:hypothetical protein M409DRAFT_38027 [Zasmidium cellare ATCC 36951]|uniref:tripeptidyl-peptidase II n=1 Tax=Zasmidium cellare ATCC 36951 TaxID=1080233 RepID=A0A6A6BWM7_ZASCE|nr:uncharacterized protein M409DRAFT_38027 [Zasmidium cellare ATCC 36951]KAF2158993.1 hypothetical protein M409DRAFT_38027 [Zasmidium cellare ATCC 36951]